MDTRTYILDLACWSSFKISFQVWTSQYGFLIITLNSTLILWSQFCFKSKHTSTYPPQVRTRCTVGNAYSPTYIPAIYILTSTTINFTEKCDIKTNTKSMYEVEFYEQGTSSNMQFQHWPYFWADQPEITGKNVRYPSFPRWCDNWEVSNSFTGSQYNASKEHKNLQNNSMFATSISTSWKY
jgi:hypothetical protein